MKVTLGWVRLGKRENEREIKRGKARIILRGAFGGEGVSLFSSNQIHMYMYCICIEEYYPEF